MNYTETGDKTLVEITLAGDSSAFAELVRRHESRVVGSAMRITRNRYSAEDAAQDAFVSAWMNLDALRDPERFGAWVAKVASNRAKNLVAHYRATCADLSFDALEYGLSEVEPTTDEASERLRDELDALSPTLRETLTLHYFGGYSVAEIAKRLEIPIGTVKWRLSEGRRQLRKGYGIMEKSYNESETLVRRVMRQVEELKLWRLKSSREGFEDFYRLTLADVESLEESREKNHALADVLVHGAWWIPGEKNDELVARIKKAALDGHNESVMNTVAVWEWEKISKIDERRAFMRDTQLPELERLGFVKTVGYVAFWLGQSYFASDDLASAREWFEKCRVILEPSDVYYANSLAVLRLLNRLAERKIDDYRVCGEVWRELDGKLYFWEQPGFSGSSNDFADAIRFYASRCDSLIFDPAMKLGDVRKSSDGKVTLTFAEVADVETPAGVFENCAIFVRESASGDYFRHAKTAFAKGVGIVAQTADGFGTTREWVLTRCNLRGEGDFPLEVGNRWEYACTNPPEGEIFDVENYYEITSASGGRIVVESGFSAAKVGYTDDWRGQIAAMRYGYCDDSGDEPRLVDVEPRIRRCEALASTKREKLHTKIAADVMRRILATDSSFTPDCVEHGMWNFFEKCGVSVVDGSVKLADADRSVSFEWKENGMKGEGLKLLYSFLYDILQDGAGCLWSDAWEVGFTEERQIRGVTNRLEVRGCEPVTTPAGVFADCRLVRLTRDGLKGGQSYRGGEFEYTFARGVGLVKMSRPLENGTRENVWELTAYEGSGEGYFPVGDGFVRRYEPKSISDGWRASVEYTFDADESGLVCFRNALGTRVRG